MRIIAIDPGKMTGRAAWDSSIDVMEAGQDPWYEGLIWLEYMIYWADVVVSESFVVTQSTLKKTRQNWSLEAIGAMRFMAQKNDTPFVLQSPGEAKSFATPDKLKAVDWWPTGQDHAQDACRHLLTYVVRNSREIGFDLNRLV